MKCPACSQVMTEEDFGGVKVDVCENGCKGIWFDHFELAKLDEKNEGIGRALQNALNSERHRDTGRGRLTCPQCGIKMVPHFYKSETMVTVDECYQCGGFYLDSGEIEVVRDNHLTESGREKYLQTLEAAKTDFRAAQAQLDLDKKKISLNEVKRAEAVTKFVGMLGHHFGIDS